MIQPPVLVTMTHYCLGSAFLTWSILFLRGDDRYCHRGQWLDLPPNPIIRGACHGISRNIVPTHGEDQVIQEWGHACVLPPSDSPHVVTRWAHHIHQAWPEYRWLHLWAEGQDQLIQLTDPRDQLCGGHSWDDIRLRQIRLQNPFYQLTHPDSLQHDWMTQVDPAWYQLAEPTPSDTVIPVSFRSLVFDAQDVIPHIMREQAWPLTESRWQAWLAVYLEWSAPIRARLTWLQDPQQPTDHPQELWLQQILTK